MLPAGCRPRPVLLHLGQALAAQAAHVKQLQVRGGRVY